MNSKLLTWLASFKYKNFSPLPQERSTRSILREIKRSNPNIPTRKSLENNEYIVLGILESRKTDKEKLKIIKAIHHKTIQEHPENPNSFYLSSYLSTLQKEQLKADSICQYVDSLVPSPEEQEPFSALRKVTDLMATIRDAKLRTSSFEKIFSKLGAGSHEREVFSLCEFISTLPDDDKKEEEIQNYSLFSYGTNFHFAQEISQDLLPYITSPTKRANLFLQLYSNCPILRTNAMRLQNDTDRINTMKKICEFYMPCRKDKNIVWQDFSLLRPIKDNHKKIEAINSILASYIEKHLHTTDFSIKQALESQMPEVASSAINIFSPDPTLDISLLNLFKKYQNTVYTKGPKDENPFVESVKQKLSNRHLTNSLLAKVLKGTTPQDKISFFNHLGLQSIKDQETIRQFHEPSKEESER